MPRVPHKNQLGIVGYLGEYGSLSDLKWFMVVFRPDALRSQVSIVGVNRSVDDENHPGGEVRTVLSIRVYASVTCKHIG